MNGRDLILTGIPRSGTTLSCHLLNRLPNTVALHEPMSFRPFGRQPNLLQVCQAVVDFFQETRRSIRAIGAARSKQAGGRVPDNPVQNVHAQDGLRHSRVSRGSIQITKPLGDDFRLCIKHPAAFTALLQPLRDQFSCWAIVRNPLSVLASWNSVDFPVRKGRAPIAERLDPALGRALDQIPGRIDRQLRLLSWFFERYHAMLPRSSVIRYEDLVASHGAVLRAIVPEAAGLAATLENLNANPLYDRALMNSLAARLRSSDGAYWRFYAASELDALLAGDKRSVEAT